MPIFSGEEVLIMKAGDKVEDGRLVDEDSRGFVKSLIEKFAGWVRLHRAA
jgi:hypothetical protein